MDQHGSALDPIDKAYLSDRLDSALEGARKMTGTEVDRPPIVVLRGEGLIGPNGLPYPVMFVEVARMSVSVYAAEVDGEPFRHVFANMDDGSCIFGATCYDDESLASVFYMAVVTSITAYRYNAARA